MQDPNTRFHALLNAASSGDNEALASLIAQYEPQLRVVARAQLGPGLRPHLDSVDLVQSVHRSLMIGLRDERFRFENPEGLLALAATLVRRKVSRHWRRIRRQQHLGKSNDIDQLADELMSLHALADDPARAAEAEDQVRHYCTAMSNEERKIIQQRLEGHSVAEIARSIGLDPNVLRVRLSRLRGRLRETGMFTDGL